MQEASDGYDESAWDILSTLKQVVDSKSPKNLEGCCSSPDIHSDDNTYFCRNCNTINQTIIDNAAEWRYYGSEDSKGEDPNRCGLPTNDLLPKSSIGSVIGSGGTKSARQIRMYQMWNSMPYWERTLYGHFDRVTSTIANHNIPSKVLEDAKVLIKKVSEKKISRGDNKDGIIASCIYYSCMLNGTPRSTKEIARIFHIDTSVLTKGNARFQNLLHLNIKSSAADDFIGRFGTSLNMEYNAILKCKEIANKLEEIDIVSQNSPTSVAAGVIFLYVTEKKLNITKQQIATACEVSAVTITKCYKTLSQWKNVIIV